MVFSRKCVRVQEGENGPFNRVVYRAYLEYKICFDKEPEILLKEIVEGAMRELEISGHDYIKFTASSRFTTRPRWINKYYAPSHVLFNARRFRYEPCRAMKSIFRHCAKDNEEILLLEASIVKVSPIATPPSSSGELTYDDWFEPCYRQFSLDHVDSDSSDSQDSDKSE